MKHVEQNKIAPRFSSHAKVAKLGNDRCKSLETALQELVDRLEFIEESSEYRAVWFLFANHGMKYTGPTYTEAILKAKAVLRIE